MNIDNRNNAYLRILAERSKLNIDNSFFNSDDLSYYSFPKIYGSTSGPFGGIGGAAMTTFQIEAYSDGIITCYYCGNRFIKLVKNSKLQIQSDI